jgi:hypothetical protein
MDRPRLSFLPTFFVILAVVFAIAVTLRIRSYGKSEEVARREVTATTAPVREQSRPPADGGTMTLEPVGGSATARSTGVNDDAASAAVRRSREEQYRALLENPAQGGGTAPAQQPAAPHAGVPSAGSSVVAAPLGQKPAAVPPPRPAAVAASGAVRPPQPSPHAQPQPQQPASREDRDREDPNSDTKAPQLLGISFTPPSIHDGEETLLTIAASDDISGVRTISGNVMGPSGALIGFAATRDGNDPTRYTSHVAIPRDAAEGMWRLNYLNLTDNASNSRAMMYAQGQFPPSATFRVVSSRPDSSPPTLKAVWLDHPAMRGGEKNIAFVQADDDKSGVLLVSGVFISPAKTARLGFPCTLNSGTNTWDCVFTPPASVDCGDWALEQIQIQDKANNMAAIRADNPIVAAVRVNIVADNCDSTPPAVTGVAVDPPVVSNAAQAVVKITVSVTDDVSGVSSVSGHFAGPAPAGQQPPRLYFSCSAAGEGVWVGKVTIPPFASKGVWKIGALQVLDKSNNLRVYGVGDAVVSAVAINVQ